MRLDVICSRMQRQAQAIEALVRGVDRNDARQRPAADAWSVLDVVNHLADEESEDFRRRLELTLHHSGETWPAIDPQSWVGTRDYQARDLDESIGRFLTERQTSLVWLGSLHEPDWTRAYAHPRLGPIRAGDLMVSWLAHDLLHLRQLAKLHHQALSRLAPVYSTDYAGPW